MTKKTITAYLKPRHVDALIKLMEEDVLFSPEFISDSARYEQDEEYSVPVELCIEIPFAETEQENESVTWSRLRELNVTRCETAFKHPINDWSPADWGIAMAGEAGEACDAIKKLRRLEDGNNTEKDPQSEEEAKNAIAMELADMIIYADLLSARLGINLEDAIRTKFNIVSDRMQTNIKFKMKTCLWKVHEGSPMYEDDDNDYSVSACTMRMEDHKLPPKNGICPLCGSTIIVEKI